MPCKILLIEDDPSSRNFLLRALEGRGYWVVPAESAERGLELLQPDWFDCVVVDYCLPGMSGVDFVKAAHRIDSRVAVVVLTGRAAADVDAEIEDGSRVWAVVQKPVAIECLVQKIDAACELTHLPPETEERIASGFQEEATRMRRLHQDLLHETRIIPAEEMKKLRNGGKE